MATTSVRSKLVARFLAGLVIAVFTELSLYAQTSSTPSAMPENIRRYLATERVMEDNMLPWRQGELRLVMDYMRANWRTILDEFDTLAPTNSQKVTAIRAAEGLDAREYIKFLQKLAEKYRAKKIDWSVFESALMPSRYKEGFLPLNHKDAEVRVFVESLKELVPPNHNLTGYPDDILSGKSKASIEKRWNAEGRKIASNLLLSDATSRADTFPGASPRQAPDALQTPTGLPSATEYPTASISTSADAGKMWPWIVAAVGLLVIGAAIWTWWAVRR